MAEVTRYGSRLVVHTLAAVALLFILEGRLLACEPCARTAQENRATANACRQKAAQLRSGGGTAVQASGPAPPSMSAMYAQAAAESDKAALHYENLYRACKAGQRNVCSGDKSGGASSSSGETGADASAGGRPRQPTPSEVAQKTVAQLSSYSAAAFQRRLGELRQINEALARSTYGGAGSDTATATARSLGNVDLEDVGDGPPARPPADVPDQPRLDAPVAPPSPSAPADAPTPSAPTPPSPAAGPLGDPTGVLGEMVPLGQPPVATPEQLMSAMLDSAAAPSTAPTTILGLPVQPEPASAQNGGGGFSLAHPIESLTPEQAATVDGYARQAFDYAAPKVFPNVADGTAGLRQRFVDFDSVTDPENARMEAAGRLVGDGARGLENEETVRKNLANTGRLNDGADDKLNRIYSEQPESSASDQEKFVDRIGNGDWRELSYLMPKPIQKVVGVIDDAQAKYNRAKSMLGSAKETAEKIYDTGKTVLREARAVRNEVRERLYTEVRGLFGYGPQAGSE